MTNVKFSSFWDLFRPDRVTRTGVIDPYSLAYRNPVNQARVILNNMVYGVRNINPYIQNDGTMPVSPPVGVPMLAGLSATYTPATLVGSNIGVMAQRGRSNQYLPSRFAMAPTGDVVTKLVAMTNQMTRSMPKAAYNGGQTVMLDPRAPKQPVNYPNTNRLINQLNYQASPQMAPMATAGFLQNNAFSKGSVWDDIAAKKRVAESIPGNAISPMFARWKP